jgi:chromosome segregation ATPase
MKSALNNTDFVDTDYHSSRSGAAPASGGSFSMTANPVGNRAELDSKVTEAQQKLTELRQQQEQLERERASLEEARRRQGEFANGREEMITALNRGIGLLEQAEFAARRDAESMTRVLTDFREHLMKVNSLDEAAWEPAAWSAELTRALTTIENARMEWNSARLKFPLLDGQSTSASQEAAAAKSAPRDTLALLAAENFGQLCRVGFALTWPVLLGALGIIVVLLFRS